MSNAQARAELADLMSKHGIKRVHQSAYLDSGMPDIARSGYNGANSDEAATREIIRSLKSVRAGWYMDSKMNYGPWVERVPDWMFNLYARVGMWLRVARRKFT